MNSKFRMTNGERTSKRIVASAASRGDIGQRRMPQQLRCGARRVQSLFAYSSFVIVLAFVIRASSFAGKNGADLKPEPTTAGPAPQRILRVAADPNNLPFSNQRLEGFENKIAELIARDLQAKLEYEWRAQRRGFFRQTLKEGAADLVVGVPAHFDMALTTAPYYRSSYVFVSRKDRELHVRSFDDPQLRRLKIGVQLVGNEGVNTPPAHALADRGIINNVVGFTLYGDYSEENPPARIIHAVAKGDIDVAIAWGPLAGYFAKRSAVALELTPVEPQTDSNLRFVFDVAVGVRKQDRQLKEEVDKILAAHRPEIERLLDTYNIPRVAPAGKTVSSL